jgi:hypothetical protein
MTSQVVLANSFGIAIASDSAVSTSDRVQNGVEKILPLPEPHKLAIVLSNSAHFMGAPWEGIISKWSKTLPHQLESLEAYLASLKNWLETSLSSVDSVKNRADDLVHYAIGQTAQNLYWLRILPFLHDRLEDKLSSEEWGYINSGSPSEALVEKISQLLPFDDFAELTDSLDLSSQKTWNNLEENIGDHYSQVVAHYVEKLLADPGNRLESIYLPSWPHATNLAPYVLENAVLDLAWLNPEFESVLCFAGYGEHDLLPSTLKVATYAMFEGLAQLSKHSYVPPAEKPHYHLLGQIDALENLLYGYDKTMVEAFMDAERRMQELKDLVPAESTRLRLDLQSKVDNSDAYKKIQERDKDEDLLNLISSSPLKNLGVFAGSLVSVQAAFATITQPNPSVGGSIDIATVNLTSGFRWLRHEG